MLVCLLRTTGEIYIEGETATRPTGCKRIELQCLVLHEVAARCDELLARGLLPVMARKQIALRVAHLSHLPNPKFCGHVCLIA